MKFKEKIRSLKGRVSKKIIDFIYWHTEIVFFSGIIIIVLIINYIFSYSNSSETIIEVKDKFIKDYNGHGTYIVVDGDENAYKIEDLLFKLKFDSTDIYTSIEIGEIYKIQTTGIRCGLFSEYPNINNVEKIEE